MNSTRKNILVVVVGYLAYVILFNLGDWSFIGCLGAIAASGCLGNLIIKVFPLTGRYTDMLNPFLFSLIPMAGIIFLRSNPLEYISMIHTAKIGILIILALGLLSITYRVIKAKINAMGTKNYDQFGFEEEDSE